MEKAKIRPLVTPKPLNRSSQILAGVIKYWIAPGVQNFVAIGSGVSVPKYVILRGFGVTSFLFFNKATAYTSKQIFTPNTLENVVRVRKWSFGGIDDYFLFRPLNFG